MDRAKVHQHQHQTQRNLKRFCRIDEEVFERIEEIGRIMIFRDIAKTIEETRIG